MKKQIHIMLIALILFSSSILLIACNGIPASNPHDSSKITQDETASETFVGTAVTEPIETEPAYDFPTDPLLYEAVPEEEYGLSKNEAGIPCAFELEGTLRTATGTSLNMIVEWEATREEGNDFATLTLDIAVEHKAIKCQNFIGSFWVNGEEYAFMSPCYEYRSSYLIREWLCEVTVEIPCGYGEETLIDIAANWTFKGKYEGRVFDGLKLNAKIPIGEKYAALKTSVNFEIENILQRPELPEGCEVTSLAILLNHLGFDVAHTYLADNYLEQGEVGEVSFYEMNVGNPREEGKSWGCYSPVIVKTANKYLADMESYYRAYNYTGYDIHELYYQLSMGHPAIVWVTMDFSEPYLKKHWTINGEKLYWKYPLHCVVISGYDMEAGTVTITDPLKNYVVTVNMKKFELRWRQMESQAVVLKMSQVAKK